MSETDLRGRARVVLVLFVVSSVSLLGTALAFQRTGSGFWLGSLSVAIVASFVLRLVERRIHPAAPGWSAVLESAGMTVRSHRVVSLAAFYGASAVGTAMIVVPFLLDG